MQYWSGCLGVKLVWSLCTQSCTQTPSFAVGVSGMEWE